MYPYFKIIIYGNWKDLSTWADHFKNLNIPYAITRKYRGNNTYEYALWRGGQEVMTTMNEGYPPNDEMIDGEIVEMYGGFEKYLEVEK